MKKILPILFALLFLFSLTSCKKDTDKEEDDTSTVILDEDEDCFIPGMENEIGLYTAQRFLEQNYGSYLDDEKVYHTYSYVRDEVYNGSDCYIFEGKSSSDPKGEFTAFALFAVEKQGNFICEYK